MSSCYPEALTGLLSGLFPDSSTKFVAAAALGSVVEAECTALHRGRTTMVWQTMLRGGDGRLCAVVILSQLVLPGA